MFSWFTDWWMTLSVIGQIFAVIAIPSTVILVLQSALVMFGFGFDNDFDADFDADTDFDVDDSGLTLFSVRGIIAFLTVGGWTGLALDNANVNPFITTFAAVSAGMAALIVIAVIFKWIMRMQSAGNLDYENALGKSATVYIPIPPESGGVGKITLLLQERFVELSAMTNANRVLKTNEIVTVTTLIDQSTVMVEPNISNEKEGISKWIQQ